MAGQDLRTGDHIALWLLLGYSSWIVALWDLLVTWIFSPLGACPFDFSVLGFHSLWNSWILGPTGSPLPHPVLSQASSQSLERVEQAWLGSPAQDLQDGILTGDQPRLLLQPPADPPFSSWTVLDGSFPALCSPSIRSWGREGTHWRGTKSPQAYVGWRALGRADRLQLSLVASRRSPRLGPRPQTTVGALVQREGSVRHLPRDPPNQS